MAARRRKAAVRLRPVTEEEYSRFEEEEVREYARQKIRAGDWADAGSLPRAREEYRGIVGDRRGAGGHRVFRVVGARGVPVGWIWVGPSPPSRAAEGQCWLYQITIDEDRRGRGYGRAALEELERMLRGEGVRSLQLHAFRWNEVALSLYRSVGYEIVFEGPNDLNLVKRLEPAAGSARGRPPR